MATAESTYDRINDYASVKISLARPHDIRSWSMGEVKKPETINYRTYRPEKDGLFCERIFGPEKDWECACGKYRGMKYKGMICDRCGVKVTHSRVRRKRMGHIELAAPVVHIWFFKAMPSRLGNLLAMKTSSLEKVIYFQDYVVIDPGDTDLEKQQLLTEEEYKAAKAEFGDGSFRAGMGAEAVRELLGELDLVDLSAQLRVDLAETGSKQKRKDITNRLKIVESIRDSDNKPEWMVLDVIPVIPPDLRPLVLLDSGNFATSDLNDLYRRIINRNNRLRKLVDLNAPEVIIRNEKRMLQQSVDALFDNNRCKRPVLGSSNRPLKSLTDMIKGKQGRFRENLLGKRVDYSARSVIVVGSRLKLHQCGLPKKIALELFQPFIIRRLKEMGHADTIKSAKKMLERKDEEVWDILEQVIRNHPVLLNRAPTLHRMGIQAFEPTLVEGNAIHLHPLVCKGFNADFDGDQMAVHVPLSLEAQLEARVLMMSTNNVLSPANGAPIIVPSQDMILGLYYITMEREGMKGEGMVFADTDEVQHALDAGEVHLHAKITARIPQIGEDGLEMLQRFETTPGRMLLGALLPLNAKAPFDLVNRLLRKKEVQQVIDTVYRYCGQKESVIFCDQIMTTGFKEAFKAGISFGKDDMVIPDAKWKIVGGVRDQVKEFEQQYMDGLITQGEKYNKVVDAWSKCSDEVAGSMMDEISSMKRDEDGSEMEPNSIYMMSHSGARGSPAQMKQLGGMRGLMAKPSGEIIETPIISNFKEGLTVLEYFNSTHGARKGLADTALKTANSGYLTRRLVDVAQDCIVRMVDCGTETAITAEPAVNDGEIVASLSERILGRVSADDVVRPGTDEVLVTKGELIDERKADMIEKAEVPSMRIRSPLTCEAEEGVCAQCYGRDLARGTQVNIGEAVGIIAAQSIGEPGTQLTMRTFHIGGIAQGGQQSFMESSADGKIEFKNANLIKNSDGEQIVIARNMQMLIIDDNGIERSGHKLSYGTKVFHKEGAKIARGDKLFEWDPYTLPIIAEKAGTAKFVDLVSGISVKDETDDATGMTQKIVTDWRSAPKGSDLKPEVILADKSGEPVRNDAGNPITYPMSVEAILSIEEGAEVKAGDVVARIPREGAKTKDITGGLPRVAELFEARRPKDHAIIAEIDGYVKYGRDYKNKRRISIEPADENGEAVEYMLPKGKHIPVAEGDFVQKGDYIMDGNPAPHDILSIMGVEALADYMIDEVQDVYRLQGVKINDKHIEVIVRQMLQKWEIQDSGETTLLKGEHVDKAEFEAANAKAEAEGRRLAKGEPILLGITKASLQTRSFISAASFQETTRVLTEASVQGKRDKLVGLKENVIVGRLIPAGTGGATQLVRRIAAERDQKVIQEAQAEAEAAAALAAPIEMDAGGSMDADLVETPESRD